ncbi:helix-turn-helix domain-containing protein [Microbacterium sp. NPDC091662]|uniref:helix-turn-helix domain-containing protein n=1 Tax=Microbacterium sp. NPDC091662 TaxID=3364211 RepID=UPI00380CD823
MHAPSSTGFFPVERSPGLFGSAYPRHMPRRAHDFRGLTQPRRLRLLHSIQQTPGHRAGALAEETGIPLNTVRDHLRVLEDEGLIHSETVITGGPGRPPVVFHPVRDVASNSVARTRVDGASERGRMLRAVTDDARTALEEDALRQVDVLYEHLDDAGLDPVVDESAMRFDLAPCRYQGLLAEDQALVCDVHAQLVRDVLRLSDGPLEMQRLDPFVSPRQCRLMLGLRRTGAVVGEQ